MAQPQRQADIHQDELCSPNKRYALMDANKKIDLDNPFVNNKHVDYAYLLWEGFHYSLEHPATLIPYPRFTKLIVSHYMTAFPEISRRARNKYHNLKDDEMVKSIFNSKKNKKSREELEAKQNEENFKEHLMAEEIEKLVEGRENVEENKVDSSTLRQNDNQNDPGTRLEPERFEKNEKGKHAEETRNTPSPITIRSPRIHSTFISLDTEKLQALTVNDPPPSSSKLFATQRLLSLFKPTTRRFKRYKSFFNEFQGRYSYLFEHLKTMFMPGTKFNVLACDNRDLASVVEWIGWVRLPSVKMDQMGTPTQYWNGSDVHLPSVGMDRMGENSAKREKTFEHGTFTIGESSSGQTNESEPGLSTSEINARRENGSIVSITKSDYKNLNKNNIEDMYLLIVNGKVDDYAETGLMWSLSVFIKSTVI
uniref:Uncharacterized protein n=1 Tax=Tanacetum cinerariifolium TaxID=118510 RepID=A0A699HN84_TANCI|nr:hypothetical protein [Tanacetum cinerariifolium]